MTELYPDELVTQIARRLHQAYCPEGHDCEDTSEFDECLAIHILAMVDDFYKSHDKPSSLDDSRRESVPVLGFTLSEKGGDFWDHLDSKITLYGRTSDPELFPDIADEICNDLLPGRSTCSRRDGHEGRHIAVLRGPRGDTACSAWPGTSRPTLKDLK